MTAITRRYEIDMGHCLADHRGKCHRPHGHRYAVEATVAGALVPSGPEHGMVADFAHLADHLAWVLDPYDHRFMMARDDPRLAGACDVFGADIIPCDTPPTAENLAARWGAMLVHRLPGVAAVAVYETPNCRAVWQP